MEILNRLLKNYYYYENDIKILLLIVFLITLKKIMVKYIWISYDIQWFCPWVNILIINNYYDISE